MQLDMTECSVWSECRLDMANVVVAAEKFNPSILTEFWLIKHKVMAEDAKTGNWIFSPMMVSVSTHEFAILAVPDRLQFTLTNPAGDAQNLVEEKVGRIVDLLPHTPYRGLGFNFAWIATPKDLNGFVDRLRQMFMKEGCPPYDEFATPDARFGAYLSKDIFEFRMRLDIKPVKRLQDGAQLEALVYNFNFHKDLQTDLVQDQISDALCRWTAIKDISRQVFERATE